MPRILTVTSPGSRPNFMREANCGTKIAPTINVTATTISHFNKGHASLLPGTHRHWGTELPLNCAWSETRIKKMQT